ncbi:MAG TPA: ankyrin repeat domain-containing protein [Candidatus Limnocylindrales bacterium]|jgi:ankyrin repeat protein
MTAVDLLNAIDSDDEPAVEALLATHPDLALTRDDDGVSAILHALYRGRRAVAQQIAAVLGDLDVFDAAALARAPRVRALVVVEPELATVHTADGFTALHYPAFFGGADAAEVARILLDAGADVNARSANDFSVLPLHSAVAGAHDDVAAVLIEAGADVNARQRHGWTPLHGAAQNGAAVSVERLLAAGADPRATNDDGVTAADLAAAAGHEELAARLR